ncbi:hypothetical protein BDN72DRAFT_848073 [Pluteus cervinus]|uniref:Uncharacterized protein n=1 Tax=Pluteus cervinus TaxID=181527 RepID=A0ACD3ABY3_9AGAR|nr:hypothetical protein BDN72DRAFT_848073 [Pluteus cervinus]
MFTKEFRDAFRKGEVLPGLKVLDLMVVNPFKDHRDDGVAHVLKELVGMVEGRWALVKERQRDLASVGGTVKGVSEACDSLVQQKQGSLPLLLPVHGEVNGGVHPYPYTNGRISVPSPVNVPSNVAVDKVVPLNKLIWDIRETEHNTFCFENFERLARLEEMGTSVKRRGSGS